MMWRHFTNADSLHWIRVLPDLLKNYNATYHSSIKMSPAEVTEKNQSIARSNLYDRANVNHKLPTFNVGDKVRISKARKRFDR